MSNCTVSWLPKRSSWRFKNHLTNKYGARVWLLITTDSSRVVRRNVKSAQFKIQRCIIEDIVMEILSTNKFFLYILSSLCLQKYFRESCWFLNFYDAEYWVYLKFLEKLFPHQNKGKVHINKCLQTLDFEVLPKCVGFSPLYFYLWGTLKTCCIQFSYTSPWRIQACTDSSQGPFKHWLWILTW